MGEAEKPCESRMADLQCLSQMRKEVYISGTRSIREARRGMAGRDKESTMYFSTMDIVLAAIGFLAFIGAAISFSAWRHAVRIDREAAEAENSGVTSTV